MSVLPFLFSHMSSLFSHVSSSWVHVEFKVCSQQVFCQKINYITWKTWPCTCAHDKWSYRTLAHSGYTYSCLIAYFPINFKKKKEKKFFLKFLCQLDVILQLTGIPASSLPTCTHIWSTLLPQPCPFPVNQWCLSSVLYHWFSGGVWFPSPCLVCWCIWLKSQVRSKVTVKVAPLKKMYVQCFLHSNCARVIFVCNLQQNHATNLANM